MIGELRIELTELAGEDSASAIRILYGGSVNSRNIGPFVDRPDIDGALVGGLYGVAIGRIFFGESMYSGVTHASKAAVLVMCRLLVEPDFRLLYEQAAHWLARPEFFAAIGEYLKSESEYIDDYVDAVQAHSPYRSDAGGGDPSG